MTLLGGCQSGAGASSVFFSPKIFSFFSGLPCPAPLRSGSCSNPAFIRDAFLARPRSRKFAGDRRASAMAPASDQRGIGTALGLAEPVWAAQGHGGAHAAAQAPRARVDYFAAASQAACQSHGRSAACGSGPLFRCGNGREVPWAPGVIAPLHRGDQPEKASRQAGCVFGSAGASPLFESSRHGRGKHAVFGQRPAGRSAGVRFVWGGGMAVPGPRLPHRMGCRDARAGALLCDQQHALSDPSFFWGG
jgi:hypothetical protein